MWLFTKHGLLSIVEDFRNPLRVLVRGRQRAHVVWALRAVGRSADEVEETSANDYPFRASFMTAAFPNDPDRPIAELTLLMLAAAKSIDYPNFKNAAAATGAFGPDGHATLMSVWEAARKLNPLPKHRPDAPVPTRPPGYDRAAQREAAAAREAAELAKRARRAVAKAGSTSAERSGRKGKRGRE